MGKVIWIVKDLHSNKIQHVGSKKEAERVAKKWKRTSDLFLKIGTNITITMALKGESNGNQK